MAEDTKPAAKAAKAPTSADIGRAREFAREPFLLEGEKPKDLSEGTPRRRALDAALAEIDEGREAPSIEWRRDFSLMLGLERLLSEEHPHLADGAELDPHQVDALSGTLAAMIADIQERLNGHPWTGNGNGGAPAATAARAEPSENGAGTEGGDEDLEEAEVEDEDEEEATEEEEAEDWTGDEDEDIVEEAPEDPGASRRFWFEHATGAGKTVAAVGFIEASRTGGILILTHRRNLVDQFIGEISDRGYADRLSPPLLDGADHPYGPVTVETYQWFVRNAGRISDAYSIVICDEAHTALGEKTSGCIRAWIGPVFIGMTATGALIARHVADLFPTQTSRFDLAQAARRGVIAPLRCVRIPPGPGVRTIAKVPLRKGEVDQDFDQE
ncbi:MAG: DEAD/DEAH box helicase family protein, partial [Solirubrobacterales bacterium]